MHCSLYTFLRLGHVVLSSDWGQVQNGIHLFSSPEHKVLMVSYCDRALSVVCRRPSCVVRRASSVVRKLFYLNIFSSESTYWMLTKLHRNDPWVVPYQSCSNGYDWLHK